MLAEDLTAERTDSTRLALYILPFSPPSLSITVSYQAARAKCQKYLPAHKTAYAMRDVDHLRRLAAGHGPAIGAYADAVLDTPLPWTKMRQVYRLLGLIRRHGAAAVDDACRRALDAEAVNVGLIERMLTRDTPTEATVQPPGAATRFVRDSSDFAVRRLPS